MDPGRMFSELGGVDIYLLDQCLKGRIHGESNILDAGCGGGRNIAFMLRNDFKVAAVDSSAEAVATVQGLLPPESPMRQRIRMEELDDLSFGDGEFDVIICNAVLHFARDEIHFEAMMNEMWRVLAPRGLFFVRLASSVGIEERVQHIEGRHYLLPDGTRRFLVDNTFLLDATRKLGAELLEPIKTVNVQGLRCMTTWVLSKQEPKG
jgi:tellurite methyltransferase